MDVIKFALGFRFDPVYSEDPDAEKANALSVLTSCIDPALLEGWHAYGGHYQIDENDDPDIYTLILMGGGLKASKKLYYAVKANNCMMSMLACSRPIFQSNIVFRIDGFEYFGKFSESAEPTEGEVSIDFVKWPAETVKTANETRFTVALAPDKYKGTLDQFEACAVIKSAARKLIPGTRFIEIPVADGGDGTAAVLAKKLNGKRKTASVTGPDREQVEAEYTILNRNTAIIESAAASGLALIKGNKDVLNSTSQGTGELIADALKKHIKRLIIGLGGSATNDGGMGAAKALGVRFYDENGTELDGCGAAMAAVNAIDVSEIDPKLKEIEITVFCDVNNPMTGENGATYTFGPQKGANSATLMELEKGMLNLEEQYNAIAGKCISKLEGAGAAGGMGAMFAALFGAKLVYGAESIMDLIGFDGSIADADLIITGEGRFDETSMGGKAVGEVIRRGNKAGIPVYVLAGSLCGGCKAGDKLEVAKLFSASENDSDIPETKQEAAKKLRIAAEKLFAEVHEKLLG